VVAVIFTAFVKPRVLALLIPNAQVLVVLAWCKVPARIVVEPLLVFLTARAVLFVAEEVLAVQIVDWGLAGRALLTLPANRDIVRLRQLLLQAILVQESAVQQLSPAA